MLQQQLALFPVESSQRKVSRSLHKPTTPQVKVGAILVVSSGEYEGTEVLVQRIEKHICDCITVDNRNLSLLKSELVPLTQRRIAKKKQSPITGDVYSLVQIRDQRIAVLERSVRAVLDAGTVEEMRSGLERLREMV